MGMGFMVPGLQVGEKKVHDFFVPRVLSRFGVNGFFYGSFHPLHFSTKNDEQSLFKTANREPLSTVNLPNREHNRETL
jgi:hypothetical protein